MSHLHIGRRRPLTACGVAWRIEPYEAVLLDLRLPNTKQEYESGLAGDVESEDMPSMNR